MPWESDKMEGERSPPVRPLRRRIFAAGGIAQTPKSKNIIFYFRGSARGGTGERRRKRQILFMRFMVSPGFEIRFMLCFSCKGVMRKAAEEA
jgi:hypothetical protein